VTQETFDVVIVGAGVVGLSVASALLESNPGRRVLVLDKEQELGKHASGRNSGVLHAGFYYSPDSLKARFCRDGNLALKKLCKEFQIPVNNCGKVVVTQNEQEEERLDVLLERGLANGVELEVLPADDLNNFEPLAQTHRRFLWSPNTAISDSGAVIRSMREKVERMGGVVRFETKVQLSRQGSEVLLSNNTYTYKHLVNAAGAQSDRLSKQIGIAEDYAMIPFMGIYRAIPSEKLPLRTLVYPVPHPVNPFLGVHFTLTLEGKVKIGPTAIPILGREQYSWAYGWSIADISEALRGVRSMIKGESHDFSQIVLSEWPKLLQREIVKQSSKLVPAANNVTGWVRKPPGIRAQLVHLPTGKLEQDFVVRNFLNSTHILNAVSPGWTSAIPFGRYVAEEFVLPNF
jgi:L-2-hydroxyglutarate oxidase LhgO